MVGSKSIQAVQGIWEKEREKNTNDCEKRERHREEYEWWWKERETQRRMQIVVKKEISVGRGSELKKRRTIRVKQKKIRQVGGKIWGWNNENLRGEKSVNDIEGGREGVTEGGTENVGDRGNR